MTPDDSVERQYRFQCSCGALTVSGDQSVTCSGCGATLGIHRVRRSRQRSGSVTYYGRKTRPVHRIERHQQPPSPAPAAKAQTLSSEILGRPTMTSIEADFEDQPGDGPHGGFAILLLALPFLLILLVYRPC